MKFLKYIPLTSVYVGLYIGVAVLVFIFYAEPYLSGVSDIRWAADSIDYILYYQNAGLDQTLIQLGQNLFGPLVILWLTDGSYFGVLGLNFIIYLVSWFVIVSNVNVSKMLLFLALSVNPMLFVSLLAVNKEIVSFLVVALYAAYLARGRAHFLFFALLAAIFVRWQNVLIIVLFELARRSIVPVNFKRFVAVVLLIIGLSLIYPSFDTQIGGVTTAEIDEQQANTTFGLLEVGNGIQRNYGYFLVVVPKVLANWFGNIPRAVNVYFNVGYYDVSDVYNTFVITGHQLAMVGIVLILLWRKRFSLANDLIFFTIIYSIIYSLGALIQYRYYFPVYLVFSIVFAQKNSLPLLVSVRSYTKA